MGREPIKKRVMRENPHVSLKEVPRILEEDLNKLNTLSDAVEALMKDERYHLRGMNKLEAEFHSNGNVTLKIHRAGETAAMFTFIENQHVDAV